MQAGRLRERIAFQRRTESLDGYGEDQGAWTAIVSNWPADVSPLFGREFFASQQTQSDISVRIVCRYSSEISGVTVKDRIQHGATYYDIRSIINVNSRNRELQFMCTQHSIS
jgi:SPP1 family predicted phage head-tail adaptor